MNAPFSYTFRMIVVLWVAMLMMACPVYFPEPVGNFEKAEKIDKRFEGEWVLFWDNGAYDEIKIIPDKKLLTVIHTSYGQDKKIIERVKYDGFIYRIKEVNLINIRDKEKGVMLFKYAFDSDDKLNIYYVKATGLENKANLVSGETPLQYMERNIANDSIYSDKLSLLRKGSVLYQLKFQKKGF